MQGMGAKAKGVAFFDDEGASGQVEVVELADKGEGFGVAHKRQVRITQQKLCDIGAVIGLHMVDDQII